jgi:3-hydroxyisobutyrate dehydrogenase
MSTVAVLGMGLLGRGFATNLLAKGHAVRVWNRTASKCEGLAQAGAHVADTPAQAVLGADRVHLVLASDTAVDGVLAQCLPSLGASVPVVDHSTNLPAKVAERFSRLREDGVHYLHAPVFMGPSNSRSATGLMLIAGPTEDVEALTPALEQMTGRVWHVGKRADKAAGIKLIGNGALMFLVGGMKDLFEIGRATDISTEEVMELFEGFNPTPAGIGARALEGGPVGFEMTMARKDLRLMIETAGAERLSVLPGVAAAMDEAISAGRGPDDFTSLAKPAKPA